MRENAPPARPTLADRQVPASSSTEHGHLSSFFQAAFDVFRISGNGEPILIEGEPTLDTAVARVVGLRACFPGEYMIVSQATGRRVLFTKQGGVRRS